MARICMLSILIVYKPRLQAPEDASLAGLQSLCYEISAFMKSKYKCRKYNRQLKALCG